MVGPGTVGISSEQHATKRVERPKQEKQMQLTQLCEKAFFQHFVIAGKLLQNSTRWRRWMAKQSLFNAGNIKFSIFSENPLSWQLFPKATIIGPVLEVHIVKILDEDRDRNCDSINC